jgi:transcriptional regulator with XRE-family HTH domain
MTQSEFAKKVGLTDAAVSRYIKNEREPRYQVLVKMCKTLNISADWLLGLIGE